MNFSFLIENTKIQKKNLVYQIKSSNICISEILKKIYKNIKWIGVHAGGLGRQSEALERRKV